MNLSRLLVYIAVTAVSTYLIRVIPLVAIQKKIEKILLQLHVQAVSEHLLH